MTKEIEILGVGSPFMDQVIEVSEEFLSTVPGSKGGMEIVDYPVLCDIIQRSGKTPTTIAGGSAANTIKGLSNLGHKCALVGSIGTDPLGTLFLERLKSLGIVSYLHASPLPTSQLVSLVTPDGQRTFRDFLGASTLTNAETLHPEYFTHVKLVHIEGYSLLNKGLTKKAMELAKEAGTMVSFDLASFEIVQGFKDSILQLLKEYVDIVFANADEIRMLTQLSPDKGCEFLKDLCKIAVVLLGKEGCIVGKGREIRHCPAYPVTPVDTTGAGDLFASGFLHGYLQGASIQECAHYGAITGQAVVQVLGAEIPQAKWRKIQGILCPPA
jgi:sugar/nucleoside kinase (ribokinase family)